MRVALFTTAIAAAAAVPAAIVVAAPTMNRAQFLSAVQCVAYEGAVSPGADLGAARLRLNTEAGKQPADVAAMARREARAISAAVGAGAPGADAACAGSQIADEGRPTGAV